MSIILEALKKASPMPEKQAEPAKAPITSTSEIGQVGDFSLSKALIIMVVTTALIASVAFFTMKMGEEPVVKEAAAPKVEKVAEGYAPSPVAPQLLAAPKQEATPISTFMTRLTQPRLTLNGIVYGIGKPAAIIENKILEEGGSIRGTKVVKIYSDKVEMLDEETGKTFTLKVD